MKKPFSIIISMVLLAAAAAGCGDRPAATPAPSGPPAVTIRTVSMFGGTDPAAAAYQQLIKDFQAAYPAVTVTDESAAADEMWKARVATDFSSDNDPDVVLYFTGADAKQLIDNGRVVDVGTIKAAYPDYARDITGLAMEFMMEPNGKAYAVPVRGFFEGLYCNKDLFDKYNLPLPTTWSNLLAAVNVFSGKGIVPIAASFSDVPHYWIEHLVLSAGGYDDHHINPQGKAPASWEAALGYLRELYEMGAFPKDVNATTNDIAGSLFKDKKAAMQLDGSWFLNGIPDQENTVIVPFPVVPNGRKDRTDIIGGFSSGFYISAKAWSDPARREAAVRFVMFMTSKESIMTLCDSSGTPAANIALPDTMTSLQKEGLTLAANAGRVDMPIDSRMSKEAWTYLVSMAGQVAAGKATPEYVLQRVVSMNR